MDGTAVSHHNHLPQKGAGIRSGYLRQITESIVCLFLAVIIFRNFQIEGYMVTTGSMAPNLLGFHKRVTCPNCSQHFAFGVAFDQSVNPASAETETSNQMTSDIVSNNLSMVDHSSSSNVECPNCGQDSIDISKVPKNHGDHLLVHKNFYQFNSPKRWEIIVFRNPQKATEAYVKRVIGLPEEKIFLFAGDILINGKITRKDLPTQKALQIPVYDFDNQPQNEKETVPRWITNSEKSSWIHTEEGFTYTPEKIPSKDSEKNWLTYRHWIRAGGNHRTVVILPKALKNWGRFNDHKNQLIYDSLEKKLICIGVMSQQNLKKLSIAYPDNNLKAVFSHLYQESHFSPITDFYGYNRLLENTKTNPVRDISVSAEIEYQNPNGKFMIELFDGAETYRFTLDIKEKRATLTSLSKNKILDSVTLEENQISKRFKLNVSLFDRQIIVAINDQELFAPFVLPLIEKHKFKVTARPIRIAASDTIWKISHLKIFRDVYYTDKGQNQNFQLKKDEYYVLGDNSPISFDSRKWPNGAVHKKYFLGKPIIVHLPSKPARLKIGNKETYIRMPDFKRIRYIR